MPFRSNFSEKQFGVSGWIRLQMKRIYLNYLGNSSALWRHKTETRLFGGERGIRTFGVSFYFNWLRSHRVQIVSNDTQIYSELG